MDAIERGLRFGAAIIVASLAAGPIFWFSALLVSLPSSLPVLDLGILWIAIFTIPYGAIFAFLPVLIGTAVMTALGAWFRWARSPLVWIAAGGLGGALFVVITTGAPAHDLSFLVTMVPNGAACAAICRAFTRWPEPDGDAQA
jgi:hypothetical protein